MGADDPGFEHVEQLHALASALQDASEQDLQLLRLRFIEEMTQEQIGRQLGVSQMQISCLPHSLLERLRRRAA